MKTLSPGALITHRRRSQLLLDPDLTAAHDIARAVCGLQAQDVDQGLLSFRVRSTGLTVTDVNAAWHEQQTLVRTWCMRGTLHFAAREDLSWILPLIGPEFIRKTQRRYQQLSLSKDDRLRAVAIIGERLAKHGAQTRQELARHLDRAGIPTEGQATIHLIRRAALEGVVCYGPYRDGEETFIPLDIELSTLDEGALWHQLVRRYLASYGPAQAADLAKWSGLSVAKARRAFRRLAGEMIPVQVGDETYWHLAERMTAPGATDLHVRLLPAYDNFLLGYQSRDLIVAEPYARRVHPGGGYFYPALLVNNRLAGTWKMKKQRERTVVQIEPFEPFGPEMVPALEAEVADLSRFLAHDPPLALQIYVA